MNNRRELHTANASQVGNGDDCALQLLQRNLLVPHLFRKMNQFDGKLQDIFFVCVTDYGNDQAPIRIDGNPDVAVLLENDLGPFHVRRLPQNSEMF